MVTVTLRVLLEEGERESELETRSVLAAGSQTRLAIMSLNSS